MLLKDCPVGSVVRLVSFEGRRIMPESLVGPLLVEGSNNARFISDRNGHPRHFIFMDPDYQFEIVRPAPEATPEPRITFTVGGQEFYVGQRVWGKLAHTINDRTILPSDECEICAVSPWGKSVIARRISDMCGVMIKAENISTTPPTPHEWKRGDWARHNEFGECFVCSGVDFAGEVRVDFLSCSSSVKPETLTFIKHIDLPS